MEQISQKEEELLQDLWKKENIYFNKFKNVNLPLGGLTLNDCIQLYLLIANNYLNTNHNTSNIRIAEIGCWTGTSSLILALVAEKFNGKVFSIDWFKGSPDTNLDFAGTYFDIRKIFDDNIKAFNYSSRIEVIESTSIEASKKCEDESLDVVFLDGDHKYRHIKRDIDTWLPKLKKGGLLCGHDCEMILDEGINSLYKISENMDIIEAIHIGVCRAVTELKGKKFNSIDKQTLKESLASGLWYYSK